MRPIRSAPASAPTARIHRAARRTRLPGPGRDPQRRHGSPDVQGDARRRHQYRQRRRVRPGRAAVGLRRCAAHRGLDRQRDTSRVGRARSPYEGTQKPLCDMKLVTLANGKSIAPAFNLFTDVPIPGRHWFIIIDDLNFSSNPKSITFGEKAGMPFVPVGIYDWTDRLDHDRRVRLQRSRRRAAAVDQPHQLPDAFRCLRQPVPLRRQRPGRAGPPEPELQPAVPHHRRRVRGPSRPARPGRPGADAGGRDRPAARRADDVSGELHARRGDAADLRGQPAVRPTSAHTPFTITGKGFGSTGSGQVTFDGVPLPNNNNWYVSWSDTQITVDVPELRTVRAGPHQLSITASQRPDHGQRADLPRTSAPTAQQAYNPHIFEVGPGRTYAPAENAPGRRRPRHPARAGRCGSSSRGNNRARWWWSIRTTRAPTRARTRAARTTRT